MILGGIGVCIAVLAASGCSQSRLQTKEKWLLDTVVTVTVDSDTKSAEQIDSDIDEAFNRASTLEQRLDRHHPGSETEELNRIRQIHASEDLWEALQIGSEVNQLTDGAFDLTIGSVTALWDFSENKSVPTEKALDRAMRVFRGPRMIFDPSDKRLVRLNEPDFEIDLGGITKGLAIDRMAETMATLGHRNTLINAVSSIRAVGPKANGEPWRIGIRSPRPKATPGLIAIIELDEGAVSTTGDYQRVKIIDGQRYHHVIDPKTGHPAPGFMSVTVVTKKSAAYADALSTGLAVMGRKKALRLVEKTTGVEAIFVDANGRTWVSTGLKNQVHELQRQIKLLPAS